MKKLPLVKLSESVFLDPSRIVYIRDISVFEDAAYCRIMMDNGTHIDFGRSPSEAVDIIERKMNEDQ